MLDTVDRATLIGHLTLAGEDIKRAIKGAKELKPTAEIRPHLRAALDRVQEALILTGWQMPLDLTPTPAAATAANGTAHDTPTTGRPMLIDGEIMPDFSEEEEDDE